MADDLPKVWEESFSHLRIRQAGSQAMCTTCLKHKAIMKRLGSNQAALMAQSKLWGAHMKKQFSDRECYWNYRSLSRIGSDVDGQSTLTLIIDSMDHAKWSLPRTAVMAAKQFNNVVRPHMECCAVIIHGHIMSDAFSATMNVGAFVFELVSSGKTDASATRRPSTSRTCKSGVQTAISSVPMRQVPQG